jgi:hypothetical protein
MDGDAEQRAKTSEYTSHGFQDFRLRLRIETCKVELFQAAEHAGDGAGNLQADRERVVSSHAVQDGISHRNESVRLDRERPHELVEHVVICMEVAPQQDLLGGKRGLVGSDNDDQRVAVIVVTLAPAVVHVKALDSKLIERGNLPMRARERS